MDAKEIAAKLNRDPVDHKNCCQSVLGALAECENIGIDKEKAISLGTCFGGGCSCGSICGAIIAALMYTGLKYGSEPETKRKGSEILKRFREKYGQLNCRELVAGVNGDRKQICPFLINDAIKFVSET